MQSRPLPTQPVHRSGCCWLLMCSGLQWVRKNQSNLILRQKNYNHNERRPVDPAVSLLFKQFSLPGMKIRAAKWYLPYFVHVFLVLLLVANTNTWKHQAPGLGFNWPSLSQLSVFVSASDVLRRPRKHRGLWKCVFHWIYPLTPLDLPWPSPPDIITCLGSEIPS